MTTNKTTLLTIADGGSLYLREYSDADLMGAMPTEHTEYLLGWGSRDGLARLWRVYTGDGDRYTEAYVPTKLARKVRRLAGSC